jgi:iron complex outermembrane recepter protein
MQLALRQHLLASTVLIGAALLSAPAFAQEAQTAEATTAEADTIVVTGSLIQNPNLVASSPVAVIGQEEIALRQSNNAEQILRDLPGVVASIGSQVNNGNAGSSYADLRGLGNFRNVVLLDGVRITPADLQGRVDLNNVPLALVQRVDTLTGGAATTYGADAVSGVINFITRSDFAGVELNVSEQITERGDGNQFRADLTLGANFDDGRGNAVVSVGYQEVDPIYQGARRISRNNYTSTSGGLGGSGTTVPSRFAGVVGSQVIDPATGSLRPYSGALFGFNFNPYNVFQVPFKRYNIFAAGRYEVSDAIEVYTRGIFSKNTVNTIIAPSGIFNQTALIPVSNPFLPAGARAQFCAAQPAAGDYNPYVAGVQGLTPAECTAAATATSTTDPNYREFTTNVARRTTELGPRVSEYTTQFFDYRAGLRLGVTDSINLDVSGAYGESQNRQTQSGYLIVSRLRTALYTTSPTSCNLGSSPTVTTPSASGLPIVLAGQGAGTSAGPGCVPVNIFGAAGSITPAQVPYLTATASTQTNASLAQARALLSGDLGFTLPSASDPIGFAIGAEYRNYKASQEADSLSASAGELGGAGGAVLPFTGGYEVKEVYGEIIAPLIADRAFFKSLTLEAGIRYSAYKVDSPDRPKYNTTTYKAGGSWEPADGFKVRGNYQRAVRAPNIAELFTPSNVLLTNLAVDPCRGQNPVTNANLRAVCIAQGAPASTIGTIPNPTAAQAQSTTAGGTYLRPETSDSYTIGVVLQPSFVPGLSITIDYYNIKIKDAISQPLPGDLIAGCFGDNNGSAITANSVNNPICQLFRRNPATGALDGDPATTGGLVFPASNSGKIQTDGIDLGINYRRDLGFARLNLTFQGNWTHRSRFQSIVPGSIIPPGFPGAGGPLPTTEFRECVGLYSQNCGSPGSAGPSSAAGSLQPEFTWNQRTTLSFGNVDVSLLWRHLDNMKVEPGVVVFAGTLEGGALDGKTVDFGRIKAYNYFDLATRIGVNDNLDFTFTVTNLLDKGPPVVGGTVGSTAFNSGNTYPSTYDALGRRFAVGARLKF